MEAMLEELIIEIKKDQRYCSFIEQEKKIKQADIQNILRDYQDAITAYQEVKGYADYMDISLQRNTLKQVKQQVSEHPIIQEYYQAYHEINALLEEVTHMVFKDISVDLPMARYDI